jgi:hypothetical protein
VKPALPLPAFVIASTLLACSPPSPPKEPDPAPDAKTAEPAASASPTPTAEPSAAPEAPKPPPETPEESLARDLLKSGGRRIGFSATKKRFVVPIEMRVDASRGLDLRFYDDQGHQRENLRVCQPGECETRLDEIVKELLPKLKERFASEGYEAIYAVGWPQGRDEVELHSIQLKLRLDRGKLTIPREKKPALPLRVLGGKGPKNEITALYPVAAQKLLGVFAKGDKTEQDFFVYKLP